MWFDEAVFYQIYPLGFCGAETENDFGAVRHRLSKIEREIPRLQEMGVTAVLFNPLFESERHGYDTVDFYKVDRRLGTGGEFCSLVEAFHGAGMRVVLDGVFNHVGRAFPPFAEVRAARGNCAAARFFHIDPCGNSRYGDGFGYADWEGHPELVKLNLSEPDVQNYLMDAVRYWIDTFGIDGLRLDVSYLLPPWFLELVRRTVSERRKDFFLMGEVIHLNNFEANVAPGRLDSATNYEGFHSMLSAFNSRNLFEIEYSLTRLFGDFPWCLYRGKHLFNFVDNHDVPRAATSLKEGRNLKNLYTLLFAMPGIPCIYYGSEYGVKGDKGNLDRDLRPAIDGVDRTACPGLSGHIAALARIKREHPALSYGSYRKAEVRGGALAFVRSFGSEEIYAAVNITEEEAVLRAGEGEGTDLLTGEGADLSALRLPPFTGKIVIRN